MEIEELKNKIQSLEKGIEHKVNNFEEETNCEVTTINLEKAYREVNRGKPINAINIEVDIN